MTIEVTQEDIDKGVPENCSKCPVARAIERTLPNPSPSIAVDPEVIEWFDGDQWQFRYTKVKVQTFIERFDAGKPVKPFSFEL